MFCQSIFSIQLFVLTNLQYFVDSLCEPPYNSYVDPKGALMIERILKKNEQNVAVAPKEPLYKTDVEQLEIMVRYTETHKQFSDVQKLEREIACLNVLFPHVFRPMYEGD